MDLMESIQQHQTELSKTELKVSQYIQKHPKNVEMYTITKIADEMQTSVAAVQRFCRVLGFKGYKDFKFEMSRYLHSGLNRRSTDNDFVNTYLDDYQKNIDQLRELDAEMMQKLVAALTNQQTNYLIGVYYSLLPARLLSIGLTDMGYLSQSADDYMQAEHVVNTLKSDDTVVVFSIAGTKKNYTNFLAAIIDELPENSFLITLNPNAELASWFKNVIVLPGNRFSNQSVVDTQSIPSLFVELLLNTIYNQREK